MKRNTGTEPIVTGVSARRQIAVEWLKSLASGLALFMILRILLVQTFTIISGSMEGTLLVGDFLVISKSAYGATIPGTDVRLPGYDHPGRGDIVVFRGPAEPIDIVKRIAGVPGDTLAMREGVLYVNNAPQLEPHVRRSSPDRDVADPEMLWQAAYLVEPGLAEEYQPSRDHWGPLVVPEAEFFMLGDNRDESRDSRYWGFVPFAHLKGRAVFLYFSWARAAPPGRFPVPRIRWNRIGDRLR